MFADAFSLAASASASTAGSAALAAAAAAVRGLPLVASTPPVPTRSLDLGGGSAASASSSLAAPVAASAVVSVSAAVGSFDGGARGLRTAFNISHPSPKSVADIMTEVKRVINMNRIQCQFDSLWSPHGAAAGAPPPTVLFCEKGPIRFEMEVTLVPGGGVGGVGGAGAGGGEQRVVRMKRVSGDSWAYKNLCNRIIPQLRM